MGFESILGSADFIVGVSVSLNGGKDFGSLIISDNLRPDCYNLTISIDSNGNIYTSFLKDMYEDDVFKGQGIYFDMALITDWRFGPDRLIFGPLISSYTMPIIRVTPHGKRVFIIWKDYNSENESIDLCFTAFIINQPPKIEPPIGDKVVNEGLLLDFTVSATDPDGDTITFSAENLPPGGIQRAHIDRKTGRFTWLPDYKQAGAYLVKFLASDGTLSTSERIYNYC